MKKTLSFCIVATSLIFSVNGFAVDYTVATTTATQERALSWEAARSGKTKQAVLQDLVNKYLEDRLQRVKEVTEKKLREGYEAASPTDKTTIEGIVGTLP